MKLVISCEFSIKLLLLMVASTRVLASKDGDEASGVCLSEKRYKLTEDTMVELKKEFSDLKGLVLTLIQTVAALSNRIPDQCTANANTDSSLSTDMPISENPAIPRDSSTTNTSSSPISSDVSSADNKNLQKDFFAAARDGDLGFINAAISQLSTSGLDLNWRNTEYFNYTALHIATREGQLGIVAALLDAEADPNVQDEWGWTPVYMAAGLGHTGALELMLDHGGDPNKLDNDGTSPLLFAAEHFVIESARKLIQAGANVNYARAQVDYERSWDGRTALHWAAYNNQADMVLLLLQNGAQKDKQNNLEGTAADLARSIGRDSMAQLIDNY